METMKKIIDLFFSCFFCLCLIGCGDTLINETNNKLNRTENQIFESNTRNDNEKAEVVEEEIDGIEKIIGDWAGVIEVNTERNDGVFDAILSINSDNTWASCVRGDFNWGTWEAASEKGNRIILTVQYEGTDRTNEWSFEKHPDGYYYEYVYLETIEIPMTQMNPEDGNQFYNDWYGETTYTSKYSEEEREAKTSISINSDGTWSSSVSGKNNNGNVMYVSESGHLIVLEVVYEGTEGTNQWGVIKKPDGIVYYEYYYGQLIEIPIDLL